MEWNADNNRVPELEPLGKNISLFYEIPDHTKQKVISNDTIRIVNVSVTRIAPICGDSFIIMFLLA